MAIITTSGFPLKFILVKSGTGMTEEDEVSVKDSLISEGNVNSH
ncbi:MAG: hypothetical protein AABY38_06080 [Planctomycetota bacterium]